MRAVVLETYGGPEVLTIRDVPDPAPGPDEVLVDVAATALNRADLLQRMGLYAGPPMVHEIPGLEFAGTVVGVGDRVRSHRIGDTVMGIVGGGSYAERLATHELLAMPVPQAVDMPEAAAIPEVFITAFDALVAQGGMTPGRVALVHAGASGVGTAAIQLCKAMGSAVVVTASEGKLDLCRGLGADLAVDYRSEDFVAAVVEFTSGRGVDVVLDVIGGDYTARNVACLAEGGTVVQVGVMGGGNATVPLGALLVKRAKIVGTTLRSRPLDAKIAITRRFRTEVLPWFEAGVLKPVVDSSFEFERVAEAHERMASNANAGKILLLTI